MEAAQPAIKRERKGGPKVFSHPTNIPSCCPALAEHFESGLTTLLTTGEFSTQSLPSGSSHCSKVEISHPVCRPFVSDHLRCKMGRFHSSRWIDGKLRSGVS